jgi:hypothetical protein
VEVKDRLVVQLELLLFQGDAQFGFKFQPLPCGLVHPGGEYLVLALALLLASYMAMSA